jgi:hypothetical protein
MVYYDHFEMDVGTGSDCLVHFGEQWRLEAKRHNGNIRS